MMMNSYPTKMEAWVKFSTPLLERHVAFDVGRHVFVALNTVEVVIAQSILLVLYNQEPFYEPLWVCLFLS